MGDWRRNLLISHSFGIGDLDATNTRYLDASGNKLHASYTAGATAPTKLTDRHGIYGDGGDYLTGSCNGCFNKNQITFCLLLSPGFVADDGNNRFIYDTSGGSYRFYKTNGNALAWAFGGTGMANIVLGTYQNYWFTNQINSLIVSGSSGVNNVWLNKYNIANNNTAWNAADPATYYLMASNVLGSVYVGGFIQFEGFPFAMTKIQADDWAIRAMMRVNAI